MSLSHERSSRITWTKSRNKSLKQKENDSKVDAQSFRWHSSEFWIQIYSIDLKSGTKKFSRDCMFIIRKLIPQVLVYNQMSHSDKVAIGTCHKRVELMSHKVEAHTERVECARHHTFSWKLKVIQSYIDLQKVINVVTVPKVDTWLDQSSDKEDRKSKSIRWWPNPMFWTL